MTYTDRSSSQSLIIFRSLQINTVSDLVSRSKTFGKKKLDESGQGRKVQNLSRGQKNGAQRSRQKDFEAFGQGVKRGRFQKLLK